MKIKETRMLHADDVRSLCIMKDWYTLGDCEEYSNMLNMCDCKNMTTNRLYKIASDIKEHSDTEHEITSIMFELARKCNTFFDIEE